MNKVDNRPYCVYVHTTPDYRVYVGMTCQKPEKRWNEGLGYVENKEFYEAIQEFGWDNISHEIIKDGLSHEAAVRLEAKLIKELNATDSSFGFNKYQEERTRRTGKSVYCVDTDTLYLNRSAAAHDLGLESSSFYHNGKHRGMTFIDMEENEVENFKIFNEIEQYGSLQDISADELTDDICLLLFGE